MIEQLRRLFERIVTGITDRLPQAVKPERTVPEAAAAEYVARYMPIFQANCRAHTAKLVSGEYIPRQWKALLRMELRNLYFTAAAAGAGGVGRLMQADIAAIDRKINEQDPYLERFMHQVSKMPDDVRTEENIMRRVEKYGSSALPVLSRTLAHSKGRPELPFEPKEHTQCKNGCKCDWRWIDIKPDNGDWDVKWVMDPSAEHCQTCIRRSEACNPLQIRGWRIVTPLNLQELMVR